MCGDFRISLELNYITLATLGDVLSDHCSDLLNYVSPVPEQNVGGLLMHLQQRL